MAHKQRSRHVIDGRTIELDADWAGPSEVGIFGFLAQHARNNPWFVGVAAILGIIAFGDAGHSPWVLGAAISGVVLITIVSTWRQRENEFERTVESGRITKDAHQNRKPTGAVGQRVAVGRDPPSDPNSGPDNRATS